MRWRAALPYLALAVLAVVLLVASVSVLRARVQGAVAITMPVTQDDKMPEAKVEFPPGFGRLGELVPFNGGFAPMGPEVAAPQPAPEFRDEAWVRAQDPASYTIQVLAVQDEAAVQRYLAGRSDRSQFTYFRFSQHGNTWFVITAGNFPSHELAASVAASTDFGLPDVRPFPRRMGAYQEALGPSSAPAVPAAAVQANP